METTMQAESDYEQETLVMPKAPRIRPMDHPLDNQASQMSQATSFMAWGKPMKPAAPEASLI